MDHVVAMALFALTMSISPGPVNLITLSTGLNHGARRALGFVTGATLGFTLLLIVIGIGMSLIAEQFEYIITVLTFLGAGLIIYFGYSLLTATGKLEHGGHTAPNLWQGAALQWFNPKAWGACIAAVGLFDLDQRDYSLYFFASMYCVICFFGIGSWAVFGGQLDRVLKTDRQRGCFTKVLGAILIVLAVFLLFQQFVVNG